MFGYGPDFEILPNPNGNIPVGGIPVNFPTMSVTPLPYPKSTGTTSLDKYITGGLSALALLTHQSSIPTANNQQAIDYQQIAALTALQAQQGIYNNGGGNTGAKVENWVKNNTGVTLIVLGAIAFYLLPSPRKSTLR